MRKKFDLVAAIQTVEVTEPDQITFGELMAAWVAAHQASDDETRLRKWVAAFGHLSAWEVTSAQLVTAATAMVESGQYKPGTPNRDIGCVGSAYKWIIGRRRAPAGFVSPTLGFRRYEEDIRRIFIESDKLQALRDLSMSYKDKRFPIFIHLLIDTGARKSELLERTWEELDLERCEIVLHTSKTDKPRVLHFTEQTASLIKRLAPSRHKTALIFPGTTPTVPKDYRASWRSLTADVGVPDLHIHDLRHDKARRLLVAGVSLPIAASIMGHSAQILERRYGHLATEDHKKAIELAWRAAA